MATLSAIAEEKEKHTLRTLMLANVSAEQMLASRGLVTLLAIALVDAACYLVIGQPLAGLPAFLAIGVAGSVPIVLLSLLLGLVARDQMSAGVLTHAHPAWRASPPCSPRWSTASRTSPRTCPPAA